MATATNLKFGGSLLVDITGVGGFYRAAEHRRDKSIFRVIKFYGTAYRLKRLIAFAQSDETAEGYVFEATAEAASEAGVEAFYTIMDGYQNAGTLASLVAATPIFNGAQRTLTNMQLIDWEETFPPHRLPSGQWLAHYMVRFTRMGA